MNQIDFSYYIINNFSKLSPNGITPLKLQKLLYYIYVWSIVANNKFLNLNFEKWNFGPVNPEVYHHFKNFVNKPITPDKSKKFKLSLSNKKFVEFIIFNYIQYDAVTLSAMTHKDLPWQKTPPNQVIDEKLIEDFYKELNFAKNFPLDKSKQFYPIETDLHYSFLLDMPDDIDPKSFSFNSFEEYLKLEKQSHKDFEKEIKQWLSN